MASWTMSEASTRSDAIIEPHRDHLAQSDAVSFVQLRTGSLVTLADTAQERFGYVASEAIHHATSPVMLCRICSGLVTEVFEMVTTAWAAILGFPPIF
jgi:hypothetical protein